MSKTPSELKQIVADYCTSKGWKSDDHDIKEVLLYGDEVFTENRDSHRWWDDEFRVVDVGGMLIGCMGAHTTGDAGLSDIGWEFDWNSLCEVEAKEVTTTTYVEKR